MSLSLFADDVLFLQRLLRAEGFYLDDLDGDWGPNTEKAVMEFEERSNQILNETGKFDSRSERNIQTLSLKAQREARLFLGRLTEAGINARIISGTRTYAEQNKLFRQGRFGNPGNIVTNARGGFSNHNFCIAWDIGIFTEQGGYLSDGPQYDQAAKIGISELIEWGGNWKKIVDKPHYQVKLNIAISELRNLFENGRPIAGFKDES
jgi:peptidoglycan L-alanyl-D-glutamate endopeptidase CwlK